MNLSEFDFPFDSSLIATQPVEPRDQARLLLLSRASSRSVHRQIADLPALLEPGDLLVVNDTKVMPARLVGRKRPSGGRVELLLVKDLEGGLWQVLLRGHVREGQVLDLGCQCEATVIERGASQTTVRIVGPYSAHQLMSKTGLMPLPPYIKRQPCESDRRWYQTLFASREGAIAAPTAGLHLTDQLLHALRGRDIQLGAVTLHVGPGTFQPVKAERIEDHRMWTEHFEIPGSTAEAVRRAKAHGRRVVAIGTTVVRTLEAASDPDIVVKPMQGETDLFIVPGYRFRVVDAMMTNFHLPRTTLLMLVSAFVGLERLREAYREAIREQYRFYSYGDAMLIL